MRGYPPGIPQRYVATATWKHSSRFPPDTSDLSQVTSKQTATQPLYRRKKWLVELVIISNEAGRNQFVSMDRINQFLAPSLRNVCQMSTEQIKFFPNTRTMGGRPYTPLRNNIRDPSLSDRHQSPRTHLLRESQGPLDLQHRKPLCPLP